MNKKTLVIHPKDPTTKMLGLIYENKPLWTICRDEGISKEELIKLIKDHDRIIFLGHGTEDGLINSKRTGYLIDDSFGELLRTKECISIWCFSDRFFARNNIKGFHTGMIISEVTEELFFLKKIVLNEEEIYENMVAFSKILADCIDEEPTVMKEYVLKKYDLKDQVTKYNRKNIRVIS